MTSPSEAINGVVYRSDEVLSDIMVVKDRILDDTLLRLEKTLPDALGISLEDVQSFYGQLLPAVLRRRPTRVRLPIALLAETNELDSEELQAIPKTQKCRYEDSERFRVGNVRGSGIFWFVLFRPTITAPEILASQYEIGIGMSRLVTRAAAYLEAQPNR